MPHCNNFLDATKRNRVSVMPRAIAVTQHTQGGGFAMAQSWSFTISGPPRTKNTGKVVHARRGRLAMVKGRVVVRDAHRIIPSVQFRRWMKVAIQQWPFIRQALRGLELPIREPVEVTAVWYRDAERGDEDRYKVALGDFLQASGVVQNDYLIHWGGGCRRDKDPVRPRTEVTLRVMAK